MIHAVRSAGSTVHAQHHRASAIAFAPPRAGRPHRSISLGTGPASDSLVPLAPGLKVPSGAAGRRSVSCRAINLDPVLQALPAVGGAAAGAVVGVPAAVIAALVVTGLSKMVDGTLHKDDKVSMVGLTATVGVEAVVLMAHMSVGAVVSCAITGRPTF